MEVRIHVITHLDHVPFNKMWLWRHMNRFIYSHWDAPINARVWVKAIDSKTLEILNKWLT